MSQLWSEGSLVVIINSIKILSSGQKTRKGESYEVDRVSWIILCVNPCKPWAWPRGDNVQAEIGRAPMVLEVFLVHTDPRWHNSGNKVYWSEPKWVGCLDKPNKQQNKKASVLQVFICFKHRWEFYSITFKVYRIQCKLTWHTKNQENDTISPRKGN